MDAWIGHGEGPRGEAPMVDAWAHGGCMDRAWRGDLGAKPLWGAWMRGLMEAHVGAWPWYYVGDGWDTQSKRCHGKPREGS